MQLSFRTEYFSSWICPQKESKIGPQLKYSVTKLTIIGTILVPETDQWADFHVVVVDFGNSFFYALLHAGGVPLDAVHYRQVLLNLF